MTPSGGRRNAIHGGVGGVGRLGGGLTGVNRSVFLWLQLRCTQSEGSSLNKAMAS